MFEIQNRAIFEGDNLVVLKQLTDESADLVYLDPPYNSGRDYMDKQNRAAFPDKKWSDHISNTHWESINNYSVNLWIILQALRSQDVNLGSYLVFMSLRLIEIQRILKPTGTVYLHCDPAASHYLKIVMDSILGSRNFRNEIVWCYRGGGVSRSNFAKKHDLIFRYCKSDNYTFNVDSVRVPYSKESVERHKNYLGNVRGDRDYGEQSMHPLGKHPEDWWVMQPIMPSSKERVGYPTQKPLALLKRIIKASSNDGDLVLDPFCGSGTTLIAAEKLNRRWVGIDSSPVAHEYLKRRMLSQTSNAASIKYKKGPTCSK